MCRFHVSRHLQNALPLERRLGPFLDALLTAPCGGRTQGTVSGWMLGSKALVSGRTAQGVGQGNRRDAPRLNVAFGTNFVELLNESGQSS